MSNDRPLLGITLMLGFCILAPLADALAKIAGQTVALGPIVFLRFAVQVALLTPFIFFSLRRSRLSWRAGVFCLLRTFLHILAIGFMFLALRFLPLADAIAIVFVLPFLNLALGALVLGETVGPVRFSACLIGFAGVLLVIQPSFAEVGWAALLPLGAALSFSVFMLITRHISSEIDPIGLQYISGAMAVVILLPLLALGPALSTVLGLEFGEADLTWHPMTQREWGLALGLGALGTLGHLLMTWSLRYAPSATVTPMQYIEIPIAALIGYVLFSEWPNTMASLGICLTMLAGLFIVFYEEHNRRRAKALNVAKMPPVQAMQPAGE